MQSIANVCRNSGKFCNFAEKIKFAFEFFVLVIVLDESMVCGYISPTRGRGVRDRPNAAGWLPVCWLYISPNLSPGRSHIPSLDPGLFVQEEPEGQWT